MILGRVLEKSKLYNLRISDGNLENNRHGDPWKGPAPSIGSQHVPLQPYADLLRQQNDFSLSRSF